MGTAAQKIAYLNETKELIKESLNTNFNSQIEDTDTFRSYVSKISDLYINWPKVEGEGTNLTLNNTRKGKMSNVLRGNASQNSTTGKNLFDSSLQTTSQSGITCTANNDGTYTLNGTATSNVNIDIFPSNTIPAGTYKVVGCPRGGSNTTYYLATRFDGDWGNRDTGSGAIITFTNFGKLSLYIASGVTFSNAILKPMITADTSLTYDDYEPYTNGASPNPDYPQDVDVVSGGNTIRIESKNLCPVSSSNFVPTATWSSLTGVNANTYTNGTKITLNSGTYTITFSEKTNIDSIQVNGLTSALYGNGTFTIDTKTNIYIRVKAQNNSTPVILKTQLEKGSTATGFVPYELQSYPINLGTMELCKIGDYQDYIYKDNGKWYKHSEIGKVVLDGSEDWYYSSNNAIFYVDLWSNRLIDNNDMLSNYFNVAPVSTSYTNMVNGSFRRATGTQARTIFKITSYTSVADFKNWLGTHNTTVYYILATPTNTEITDQTLIAQLNNFEKAKSYNSQTNISQENNDLPFIINATALMGNSD